MLQNLSQFLTQTDPKKRAEPALASHDERYQGALRNRAEADAELRAAEAAMWRSESPAPDPQSGELWVTRPDAWSRAAAPRHIVGPSSGVEIAPALTLYHDCPVAQLSLRQDLTSPNAPAPFSLYFDILHFEGSFLSLCFNLDPEQTRDWHADDVIRVQLDARMEAPLAVYARLNLKQGPNDIRQLAQFGFGDTTSGRRMAAFDLAGAGLDSKPVDAVWIDLILEKPAMNAITLKDLTVSRSKRAGL